MIGVCCARPFTDENRSAQSRLSLISTSGKPGIDHRAASHVRSHAAQYRISDTKVMRTAGRDGHGRTADIAAFDAEETTFSSEHDIGHGTSARAGVPNDRRASTETLDLNHMVTAFIDQAEAVGGFVEVRIGLAVDDKKPVQHTDLVGRGSVAVAAAFQTCQRDTADVLDSEIGVQGFCDSQRIVTSVENIEFHFETGRDFDTQSELSGAAGSEMGKGQLEV